MKQFLLPAALLSCVMASPQFAPDAAAQSAATPATALLAPKATSGFLASRQGQVVWDDDRIAALRLALEGLAAHGLTPSDYHLDALSLSAGLDRDRMATDAWFSAAAHMLSGKLDAVSVEPDWTAVKRSADLQSILAQALETRNVGDSLNALAPKQAGYAALMAEYKSVTLQAAMPQTTVTPGEALKPGMSGPRIKLLQQRLAELGHLDRTVFEGVMDSETVTALKNFQAASDLDDDGVAGAATVRALNRGFIEKMNQLRVNLERWRWLPDDLGRRHLRANIAGFNVTAWEDGVQQRSHLTIVGKPYRKTPVFSDKVSYIVLNPWWETPRSLATRDKLPTFRKDPAAVERLGFQILDRDGSVVKGSSIDWNAVSPSNFPYRIRQAPGPLNALGQVKIMFPNKHNVYLHDTPTRGLFAQRQRAFSSGCLRTEKPLELSAWLLEGTPDWNLDRINKTVATGKETRVNLSEKVDVHILYFTVVSEGKAGIRYLDDIYDRDSAVLAGLNAKPRTR
ncbi:L,D-transpeptidase family protein [Litorimonas sp. WD9-15]|uniref:L,D-transpeptidase family protein n=1 Tax=Litorimonas sp. WD9-15 TaxID=3418716 RepID=UPI003D01FA14